MATANQLKQVELQVFTRRNHDSPERSVIGQGAWEENRDSPYDGSGMHFG